MDWGRCEARHDRARQEEKLGLRCPFTEWRNGRSLPDYAWNDWGAAQTERILDLMDITFLRLARVGLDATSKTLVWNLSQNVDRAPASSTPGICPCLTPTMIPFVTNRGGPLVGLECLSLQGIPVHDLLLTRETESQMLDLAGNAMTTTVVGAAILSALAVARDVLAARTLARPEKSASDARGNDVGLLPPGAPTRGVSQLRAQPLELVASPNKPLRALFEGAHRASRMCECEGRDGVASRILLCGECGHTVCAKCAGRPKHAYRVADVERASPTMFATELRASLPAWILVEHLGDAAAGAVDAVTGPVHEWKAACARATGVFLLKGTRRATGWVVEYARADDAEISLELTIRNGGAEWRVFAGCAVSRAAGGPLSRPLARARVREGADTVLAVGWELYAPTPVKFEMTLRGAGDVVSSWQRALGMPEADDLYPEKRWTSYEVTHPEVEGIDVTGTYRLLKECGGVQDSLYRLDSSSPDPGFFFLDAHRAETGSGDRFVFADSARRLAYGEPRCETVALGPSFRPGDVRDTVVAATAAGRWIPSGSVRMTEASDPSATVCWTTRDVDALAADYTKPVTILKAAAKAPGKFVRAWPLAAERVPSDVELAWLLDRVRVPELLLNWRELGEAEAACELCAPAPPQLRWERALVADGGSGRLEAREDPQQAASYERALKRRPEPLVLLRHREGDRANVTLAANPAALAHQALATMGPARDGGSARLSWRLVARDRETPADAKPYALRSNRDDAPHLQPERWNTATPLRPEQLRSLAWMLSQEASEDPYEEEEVAEVEVRQPYVRLEARAVRRRLVRGGVIADQVGYGKTAIAVALVLESRLAFGAAPMETRATLVLAPSQLLKQWPEEIEKFTSPGALRVVVLRTLSDISKLTIRDVLVGTSHSHDGAGERGPSVGV